MWIVILPEMTQIEFVAVRNAGPEGESVNSCSFFHYQNGKRSRTAAREAVDEKSTVPWGFSSGAEC